MLKRIRLLELLAAEHRKTQPRSIGSTQMSTTSTPALGLVGGHVALDLVNTVSWRLDKNRRRDNLHGYAALIGWCQLVGLLGPGTAHRLLAEAPGRPRLCPPNAPRFSPPP